jgi:hypothetical protein
VLIYSQFTRTLDILEDWVTGRGWGYERIDGELIFGVDSWLVGWVVGWVTGRGWGYERIDGESIC